jgi:hypothetical protein
MAEPPAITEAHYPAALLRVVNPIVRLLLRTSFTGVARKQLMVLSFTGRKTGRQYAIPFSAHRIDDDLYALTNAGWKHNFRGGAAAQVLHAGKTTTMRGEMPEASAMGHHSHRGHRRETKTGLTGRS